MVSVHRSICAWEDIWEWRGLCFWVTCMGVHLYMGGALHWGVTLKWSEDAEPAGGVAASQGEGGNQRAGSLVSPHMGFAGETAIESPQVYLE